MILQPSNYDFCTQSKMKKIMIIQKKLKIFENTDESRFLSRIATFFENVNFCREFQLFSKKWTYIKNVDTMISRFLSLFHSLFRFLFLCPVARLLARVSWSLPLSLSFPGCSPANPSNIPVRCHCTDHQKTHTQENMVFSMIEWYNFWIQGSKTVLPGNFLKNHWF